jgi:hypothetical protein
VAAFLPARERAAEVRADRGADTADGASTAASGTSASGTSASGTSASGTSASGTSVDDAGITGLVAVEVVRFRAPEPLGVPACSVIAQVVVDIPRVVPIAPVGRRLSMLRRAYIAIPNVKVISFAAHASSLVARRSR